MRRKPFMAPSVLSLLLCVTCAALWARSARHLDSVGFGLARGGVWCWSSRGRADLVYVDPGEGSFCRYMDEDGRLAPAMTSGREASLRTARVFGIFISAHMAADPAAFYAAPPPSPIWSWNRWVLVGRGRICLDELSLEPLYYRPRGPGPTGWTTWAFLESQWWRATLAFSLLPIGYSAAALAKWWRSRRKDRLRGLCPTCGYDLTGNVSGTCPECGTPAPLTRSDGAAA